MNQESKPKLSSRGIKRLIELLLTYRRHTFIGLFGVILSDSVQLFVPWLTKVLIDRIEAKSIDASGLILWGAFIIALGLLSFASKQLWRRLILGASKRIEADLRRELLDKTVTLTMAQAQETEGGKFMSLTSNDIPAVGQAVAFGLVAFFDSLFITIVAALLMFGLSPELTMWALLPFPILGAFMAFSLKAIYARWDSVQESSEVLTEKVRESLLGMRTLRSYVQAEGDIEAFEQKNQDYLRSMMGYVKIDATFPPLILLFAGSSTAVLLFVGGKLVLQEAISVGSLAAFLGYLSLLTWPMIAAGWMLVLLQRGSASIDRLDKILSSESESQADEKSSSVEGALRVENLTFSYDGRHKAIKDWSLNCSPGQVIGIVGPVGSGKSTLLRLLKSLEKVPENSIFVGPHDISKLNKASVRQLFSTVDQEPFLFSDTIASNLRLGNASASDEELEKAIEVADLTAELALFPDGLETELGERGVSLSGGQRQRTALARAWLKPSPFLLLDDTLSAVDTLTEQRILKHLQQERLHHQRGVIIVSHRLSAVKDADEILVARDGLLIERGTHSQLIEHNGLYAELWRLQENQEPEHVY